MVCETSGRPFISDALRPRAEVANGRPRGRQDGRRASCQLNGPQGPLLTLQIYLHTNQRDKDNNIFDMKSRVTKRKLK